MVLLVKTWVAVSSEGVSCITGDAYDSDGSDGVDGHPQSQPCSCIS